MEDTKSKKKKMKKKPSNKQNERPKMPSSSKLKESRAYVKQLEYEIEQLEWMQPDALSAVRFHRFVAITVRRSIRVLCWLVRGRLDGVRGRVFRINY